MSDSLVDSSNHHVCGNCDTSYEGNYCPECGQSKTDINRPFSVLLVDLLGNMYAFDTRLLKTLKSVLYKPGELAIDYVAGRRVRYMPPFRLYVFFSLIFFLLLSFYSNHTIKVGNKESAKSAISINIDKSSKSTQDKTINYKVEDIQKNPKAYINKFLNYFSWSLFLLMPFYAFLTWLFFRRSRSHYLAHLIFSISQHTFIFIIFIILITISLIFPHKQIHPESWLLLTIPVYISVGARKLFRKKWKSIVLRFTTIWFIYLLSITLVVGLLAYLVFMTLDK